MCFGGSGKKERRQLRDIAGEEIALRREGFSAAKPFLQSRLSGGLPFLRQAMDFASGTTARALAPRRAELTRRAAAAGISPDDPAFLQTLGDFGARAGRQFDDTLLNLLFADEASRQAAARGFLQVAGAQDPARTLSLLLQT